MAAGTRVGLAACAVWLAAGCSGGERAVTRRPGSTTSTSQADPARARDLVVHLGDLPAGSVGRPHRVSPEDERVERELRTCLGAGPPPVRTADVSSDDYQVGQAQVTSRVTMTATVEEATREHAVASGPQFARCLTQVYRPSYERSAPGARVQELKVDPIPMEALADGLAGHRLTATVTTSGGSFTHYADLFLLRAGRAEVSVNFVSTGAPVPTEAERSVLTKIARRARA